MSLNVIRPTLSSSGFPANCIPRIEVASDSSANLRRPPDVFCASPVPVLMGKTLVRFWLPFGVLRRHESRPRFRADPARLLFLPASRPRPVFTGTRPQCWAATSGLLSLDGSCARAAVFDAANPPHAPVGFILFREFSCLTRVAPPLSRRISGNRGRVPLMRSPRRLLPTIAVSLQSVARETIGFPVFAGCRPS